MACIIYGGQLVNLCLLSKDLLNFEPPYRKYWLCPWILLDILKIKDLKTTNRDRKKANKQNIRYYSIDSNGQDNN